MSAQVLANIAGWTVTGPKLAKLMPDLQDINVQAEQKKAIEGNIAEMPQITALQSQLNKFNSDEIKKMYEAAVPGYDEMMTTGGKQINSMLKGELPEDVQRQIARSSGAKSYAGGYGGSPMAGAASAESLGLASLNLIREGLSSTERWLASASSRLPHLADATSMFVSPMQQLQADVQERNTQWNRLWAKRQLQAMPTGLEQAGIGITDWLENIGASAATMGMGMGMGGGGASSMSSPKVSSPPTGVSSEGGNFGGGGDNMGFDTNYGGSNFGGWPDSSGMGSMDMWA